MSREKHCPRNNLFQFSFNLLGITEQNKILFHNKLSFFLRFRGDADGFTEYMPLKSYLNNFGNDWSETEWFDTFRVLMGKFNFTTKVFAYIKSL